MMGRGLHWLEGSGTFADQLQSVTLVPFSFLFLSVSVVNVVAVSVLILIFFICFIRSLKILKV